MNKIIAFLSVVALCVAMLYGSIAFAAGFGGEYVFVEEPTFGQNQDYSYNIGGKILQTGKTFEEIRFFRNFGNQGVTAICFVSGVNTVAQYRSDSGWSFDRRVQLNDFDTSEWSEAKTTFFYNNVIAPYCDGSSCPATDVNDDMICDDCGMMLYRLGGVPNGGYPSTLPVPPAEYESYTILVEDGVTWLYMVNGETPKLTISDANEDGERTLVFSMTGSHPQVNIQRYRLIDGSWAYSTVNSLRSFTFNESFDFVYTTVDINDAQGNLFFPLPLWQEMEQVTQGTLVEETIPELNSTLLTLALCGVGCLAFLIALPLLRKVFSTFRVG